MKYIYVAALLCCNLTFSQNTDVVNWINKNAVVIEDANADTPLAAFAKNVPQKFKDARVFGFGEASHHGKEFFNLKAKFFKYLVEQQGVRIFIMEESYQAEQGINEWISAGKGDRTTILKNFGHYLWQTQEVLELLQWMRTYNGDKPREAQIRFYGVDNQMGYDINKHLRTYVQKYNIMIDESLLAAADSCSAAQYGKVALRVWDKKMLPKLQQIKQLVEQNKSDINTQIFEYNDIMRGLERLEQYTVYIAWPAAGVRDNAMYLNVLKILEIEGANSKAFIWAHNEHINKKDFGTAVPSMGSRLKEYFKEGYYAMGFDFGGGKLKGYKFKNNEVIGQTYYTLDKPYKKTFAETLVLSQPDIFFIDMDVAEKNPIAANFFGAAMKQLFLGGPGFDPKKQTFFSRKYTEAYDGLIFVKTISPVSY
ncbi:hypothetical protein Q765_15765 [Flavobacterium rivuli WB 3.3-2 = DSM 21788]|uniref:Erythromycin esterase n=1 Tax=Flavobacterium rivuli WB 3.3-2 = DSM 21788 TaxID=1121895 RepID=A0A0A2LZM1_9FLAO|nr:erythromycin esterase family protein [Flavobacterium rivuli]KGO85484.1 hypothetical protein Q765_15765 [Flavobacterium rivuli WB 3.3-2 = DSM 21788]